MLTVILPASHVHHFFCGVSDPFSQAEEENTVFEALDCKPWGAVGYAPDGWFELGIPSERELGASLSDCVGGPTLMFPDAGNDEGSTIPGAATPSSGSVVVQTSIMPLEATCSPDDLDTDTNTKGLGSEPPHAPSNSTDPCTTTDNISNIERPSTSLVSSTFKWPPTELPTFIIDSPASWDGNHAHPEDVYLAAYDDGAHLFVPMVGAFGKLDREWERRFFPMAEEAGACATAIEGDESGEGGGKSGLDGVVNVEDGANDKN
ncbi:uncharacterized protein STEHIDRAFT_113179 [Stereum hirsutum FP-91666 SS1]|uniref:uncharacterized protein n=1 Tax=Stereum hirsutum (strain FP-91666) TaxID=721885 RepID=UPI0004449D58|nr:uncharacterized protein STEHIDRAFT_113179 [Stereum hirsutum FP-91666 SS1]EIM83953.1 hypothetical protein STEHIDRAFT_113179 [Stereum hirsutum FP-91666 SS1]